VPVSDEQWQRMIVDEVVGRATPGDQFTQSLAQSLEDWVPIYWLREEGRVTPYLRYLYAKLGALERVQAEVWQDVDARVGRGGVSLAQSQTFKALDKMAALTERRIDRYEAQLVGGAYGASGGPAAGPLAPLPTFVAPDPDDPFGPGGPLFEPVDAAAFR
jgi:hypothetical protein